MSEGQAFNWEELRARFADGFGLDDLEFVAKLATQWAEKYVPGVGEEKKKAAKLAVRKVFEGFDNFIPILGAFADLPVVDWIEEIALDALVDWAWAWGVAHGYLTSTAAAAPAAA